jgi:hypothetical protein
LWRISDLEDSRGRYSGLLNTYYLHGIRVISLDVRDEKGVHIHVSEYNSKLKEGAIILEVIAKLTSAAMAIETSRTRANMIS